MFVDRQSTYPNRYRITTESGEVFFAVLERADNPIIVGTPLNAATLNPLVAEITKLRDEVNELRGLVVFNGDISFTNLMTTVSGIGTDNIIEGKKYSVNWNGTKYECTAVLNGSVMLGNLSLMEMGGNTGEPFCMELLTGNTALIYKTTAATETIAVKITAIETT